MPAPGSDIVTSKGRGRVLGQEILAKQLLVQMEDDRRILIALDEVIDGPAERIEAQMEQGSGRC